MFIKLRVGLLYVAVAIVLTGIASLSAHALLIQYFKPPVFITGNQVVSLIVRYLVQLAMVLACMFIYLSSKEFWLKINLVNRIILFAILLLALKQLFLRLLLMNVIVGASWIHEFLSEVTIYISYLAVSCVICIFVQMASISEGKWVRFLQYLMCILLIMTILFLQNKYSLLSLFHHIPQLRVPVDQVAKFPYGWKIIIPAYITFLEPTIAVFVVFYLIRGKLSAFSTLTRGLIMAAIIVALEEDSLSILKIVYSKGDIFYRILYYGQFLWESLILGLLTACSFKLFQRYQISICSKKYS